MALDTVSTCNFMIFKIQYDFGVSDICRVSVGVRHIGHGHGTHFEVSVLQLTSKIYDTS